MSYKINASNIQALHYQLDLLGVTNPEYSKDQMITLLSPVATLHHIIKQIEDKTGQNLNNILVVSEDHLSSFNNGEAYKTVKLITGKEKINIQIILNKPNDVLLDSILSENYSNSNSVKQVTKWNNNHQLIYWPQPNIEKNPINAQAINESRYIITSHSSDIERTYDSLLMSFKGLKIEPCKEVADNKNPFSIRTEEHSWGCIFGRVRIRDGDIPKQKTQLEQVIPVLFNNYIELSVSCGTTIYAFGSLKYPLVNLLCGYAVNIKDRAIFTRVNKEDSLSYVKVGNISEIHAQRIESTRKNKEDFLELVIEMILSFGLPFAPSEKEQSRLVETLTKASSCGHAPSALSLAAFFERKKDYASAYEIIKPHSGNPYCLYNMACLNIELLNNAKQGVEQLIEASSMGFVAAQSALIQMSLSDPNIKQFIELSGITLSTIYASAIDKNDPDTLKAKARTKALEGDVLSAEDYLFRVARQGDREAISLLLELYKEMKERNLLTKKMKARKKEFSKKLIAHQFKEEL
jgi:hypothetical protein